MPRRLRDAADPFHTLPSAPGGSGRYVMKAYPDGSWVVVDVVSCRQAAPACYLTCNDGNEPGLDGAAGTTPAAAAPRGALPSLLADFERCGDHATAQGAAVPAI